MRASIALFLASLLCGPLVASATGGIAVSVSSVGADYVIKQFIPIIESKIENTVIPGVSGTVRRPRQPSRLVPIAFFSSLSVFLCFSVSLFPPAVWGLALRATPGIWL